ncbi:MAG: rRNA maturation RNase YbeY [Bacillota bacterium]|nr:rRNA maturation RNase YbeY [Bacillota bacterium]
MEVLFSEEQLPPAGIAALMERAAVLCGEREGLDPERLSVSVTFVDREEMRELNRRFRGKDAVTDVLSFPQYGDLSEAAAEGTLCLGDVVLCPEQAILQADDYGHSPEREMTYLFVHGMFHLLGYDHPEGEPEEAMRAAEEEIMDKLGLSRQE